LSANYVLRIWYGVDWYIRLNDLNFHFIDRTNGLHYWIGIPDELFDDDNVIVGIICRSTNTAILNPFSNTINEVNNTAFRLLFNENLLPDYIKLREQGNPNGADGRAKFENFTLISNATNKLVLGKIYDAVCTGSATVVSSYVNNDTIEVGDETWGVCKSTAVSIIRCSLYRIGE
jgi:hypothetical protein